MLDQLKMVRGGVADKDLVPVLTHFHIYDGRIQGANGRIAIDAACEKFKDFSITVPAKKFLTAVDACSGEPKLSATEDSLTITRGGFRARLPLAKHEDFPRAIPDETDYAFSESDGFISALSRLRPFVSDDASRMWACGILLKDGYAHATNNVVLARAPIGWSSLDDAINVPSLTVDELIRIGKDPVRVAGSNKSITFYYDDGSWLKTNVLDLGWPDISSFFSFDHDAVPPVPDGLLSAVETVTPFSADMLSPVILFGETGVSTREADSSAAFEGITLPEAAFQSKSLVPVLKVARQLDLSRWPDACPFVGEGIDGVAIGVRQ